ncbi:MAG: hypothetical protein PVJ52_02150 [Candidatus Woesebacteria bacterium]
MAKRRTKKQKRGAKHPFAVSWSPKSSKQKPKAKKGNLEAIVKGQSKKSKRGKKSSKRKKKHAYYSDYSYDIGAIRRDLIKSLSLASLIFSLEIMLYLLL